MPSQPGNSHINRSSLAGGLGAGIGIRLIDGRRKEVMWKKPWPEWRCDVDWPSIPMDSNDVKSAAKLWEPTVIGIEKQLRARVTHSRQVSNDARNKIALHVRRHLVTVLQDKEERLRSKDEVNRNLKEKASAVHILKALSAPLRREGLARGSCHIEM